MKFRTHYFRTLCGLRKKRLGETRRHLAARLDVSEQTVKDWRSGKHAPRPIRMKTEEKSPSARLASVLGVPEISLWTGEDQS